jgi:glycosyltransferase involved in cell wall biosynthesis
MSKTNINKQFDIKVLQPLFPHYRKNFFQRLHNKYRLNFFLHYSELSSGFISESEKKWAKEIGKTIKLFNIKWQCGVNSINIQKNTILIVPSDLHYLSTLFLVLKAKYKDSIIISWGHYLSPNQNYIKFLFKLIFLKIFNANIFYTEYEANLYQKKFKNSENIFFLNNGIDYTEIKSRTLKYDPYTRLNQIVFIGRITKKSNFNLLIKSFDYINDNNLIINVIGDMPVDRFNIDSKYSNRIVWHGMILDEDKIARIMNSSLLFVYPGSVGLSLIHAMAYGLPCIIHNNRSNHMPEADAFFENNIGFSFFEDSALSLAHAIDEAKSNPNLLIKISECSTNIAEKRFNTEVMATNFFKIINWVVKEKK